MLSSVSFSRFSLNVLFFIFSIMLLSFICRFVFIIDTGVLKGAVGSSADIYDTVKALVSGARYDGRMTAWAALVYIVLYIVLFPFGKRAVVLTFFSSFLAFAVIFLSVCNSAYYAIYGDTFNAIILGLIYDDREAILKTGIFGNYNMISRTCIVVFSTAVFAFLFYKAVKKLSSVKICGVVPAAVLTAAALYCTAFFMASTFNLKGGSLDYLITPAKNAFLRKATPGAVRDMIVVYHSYKDLKGGSFENYSQGFTPEQAASFYFGKDFAGGDINLNELMKRTVLTGSEDRIKHIFVVISESLSEWHFDGEFESAGIASGLKEISSLPDGKKMPVFIQNAEGTIGTVDVMLTGLYNTDVPISDMIGRVKCFPSSCVSFKKLGYRNIFYYFGSPTWRKLDRYTVSQGFDEIFSIADMNSYGRGVWGVYDDKGFDFVLKETLKHADEPTFSMILTTSYHSPYDVPLKNYGAPVAEIKEILDRLYPEDSRHRDINPVVMAHAWYADKALSNFIKEAAEELPDSLIIVTGDHFDRMHPSPVRDLRTRTGIPLILYGKNVKDANFTSEAGSHIDIIPTILEIAAPKGFEYYSFGQPLLSLDKNAAPDEKRIALGYDAVASGLYIAGDDGDIQFLKTAAPPPDGFETDMIKNALLRKNMGRALSWFMIYNGSVIKSADGE